MKHISLLALILFGGAVVAQDLQFDYDRSAHFGAYKTYQWVEYQRVEIGDQLLDRDIKRAVDDASLFGALHNRRISTSDAPLWRAQRVRRRWSIRSAHIAGGSTKWESAEIRR